MAVPDTGKSGSRGRKRGGPRRVDRTLIIETAKSLDPQSLTMQAVADAMGVDRKALNYHVADRDNLLRLVAADLFESALADTFEAHLSSAVGAAADWRDALRAWAVAVRDRLVATGVLASYYRLNTDNVAIFEPVELVLRQLGEAGFDEITAGRSVVLATRLAMAVGRDIVMQQQLGVHPQADEVERLLAKAEQSGGYEGIRGLASAGLNSPADIEIQFDFEIDVLIRGLEQKRSGSSGGPL
jgi:TetR/AcrR family transcriptional regulator, tetracycline repressor protein